MRWLAVLLTACTYPPPQATAADAQRANLALSELTEGRTLLIERCTDSACHRTPLPQDVRASEWPQHVADMAERAKLDRKQQKLIEQYLVTMAR
jgi:hypothetical protein